MTTSSDLRCLDRHASHTDCVGEVQYRDALSNSGISYPRCEHHWRERLTTQAIIDSQYPDQDMPPDWFDPADAGEQWDED